MSKASGRTDAQTEAERYGAFIFHSFISFLNISSKFIEMTAASDPEDKSNVLDCLHPSALRHFERAHMIARDLDISQSTIDKEQSANRCRQWVLNESGNCPRDVASWDGSIKYDSHEGSGRLEMYSVHSGALDSYRSGLVCPAKALAQNLESWNSSRSPTMCHTQAGTKSERPPDSDVNGIEAPRSSSSPNTKLEI